MDDLSKFVARQLGINDFSLYSHLPFLLSGAVKIHPKQIKQKADQEKIALTMNEVKLYGYIQAIFNAKPDLAIVIDDYLIVFEAKLTIGFHEVQLNRTRNITEIWANLLYSELGFDNIPSFAIIELGLKRSGPDLSWEELFDVVKSVYTESDRTHIAFSKAVSLPMNYDKF